VTTPTHEGQPPPFGPPEAPDARFCEAMEAVAAMIWVSDAANNRFWFNRVWLDFTGQAAGGDWADALHPEDRDRALEIANAHFEARRRFRLQYRLRRRDGEYRRTDETAAPRLTREGGFLGYVGVCVDVDDASRRLENETAGRARTEEDLAHSSDQLAILIDGIQDYAIYLMDAS
jgi:PAS domain S-box-containing protein